MPTTTSPAGPPTTATGFDVEGLLNLQVPGWIRVSPSGKQVIYTTSLRLKHRAGEHAVSTIWLATTGEQNSARRLTSGLFDDRAPAWCPDGESIAFLSDRAKPGKSCAIWLLSLHGGEAVPLTPVENERRIERFVWSPEGKFIAFMSPDEKTRAQKTKEDEKDDARVFGDEWEFNRLRLLHVSSGNVETLVSRDAHVGQVGWRDDGKAVVFTAQQTPELDSPFEGSSLEVVSLAHKKTTKVCELYGIISFGNADVCMSGDQIYFAMNSKPGTGPISGVLRSANVKDGTITRRAGGSVDCVENLARAGDETLVYVLSGLHDEIRDLKGNVLISEMTQFQGWHAGHTSSGEDVIAVGKGSPSSAPEVFASVGGGELLQLSSHGGEFATASYKAVALSLNSTDGKVTLDGLFVSPGKDTSEPQPTVVVPHGGPYSRFTGAFMPGYGWGPYLLSSGYAVMYPNYRGGSSRGEEFANYALGGMGTVDYDDVITMTQHCIETGLTDKNKVIVGGWSQGGFLSYLSAVRNGTHGLGWTFKGAICGAGVSDWDAMAMTSDVPIEEGELSGLSPWCAEKSDVRSRHGSAVWELAEAAKAGRIPPVLILHGEQDERVPVTQAWGFQRGCRHWKAPCEMVTYPREGHVFAEKKHWVDMFHRVKRFCDMHISP